MVLSSLQALAQQQPREYASAAANFAQKCEAAAAKKAKALADLAQAEAEKEALESEQITVAKLEYDVDLRAMAEQAARLDYQKRLELADIERRYDLAKAQLQAKFSLKWTQPMVEKLKCFK